MKRKGFAVLLVFALFISGFCGCKNGVENQSSLVASSEQMVIGSVYEGIGEYPGFNESVDFSDVSVPLTSDIPSKESSNEKESSADKNESGNKSSSSKAFSSKVTSTSSVDADISAPTSSVVTSVSTSSAPLQTGSTTVNYKTMKAVWVSYIDFANILTGKTESQFRSNFKSVCENAVDFGINTLICQVRAFGDAIYPSEYFAWSQMAAGVGKNPGYDPLKIMIEIAHQYNLSFHAWINPFRTFLTTQISSVPSQTVFKKWYNDSNKKGKYIVQVDNRWYYNPAEPEVRELILNGVKEIINNYKVDGIHFDDYFYPTTAASFDSSSYATYGAGKTLANFRRANVSSLVKSVYNAVKQKNSNIIFGISPQANVDNDMNSQYADVKLWGSQNGYVDYLCPQIYFNYVSESSDFASSLSTWNKLITASNVKLMVGLAVYRVGCKYDTWACTNRNTHTESTLNCGAYGWRTSTPASSNILARQYDDCMSLGKCGGVFLYSYQYLFNINSSFSNPDGYVSNAAEQAKYEMQKLKAAMK